MTEKKSYVSERVTNGQRLTISYGGPDVFAGDGIRDFFEYRDLGFKASTGGQFSAQVIRAKRGMTDLSTGMHSHALNFQMIYFLRGSTTVRCEGEGVFRLKAGDSILQPPGGKHEVLDFSDDLEFLEIVSPAEYVTTPG